MIYVLKCCSSVYDRDINVVYSDDYEKLDTFIEMVATYFQYPESYLYSFNGFLTQIQDCKNEWVEDFDKMYLVLNAMVGREYWWDCLEVHKIEYGYVDVDDRAYEALMNYTVDIND